MTARDEKVMKAPDEAHKIYHSITDYETLDDTMVPGVMKKPGCIEAAKKNKGMLSYC